jgi:hypothetical protein
MFTTVTKPFIKYNPTNGIAVFIKLVAVVKLVFAANVVDENQPIVELMFVPAEVYAYVGFKGVPIFN